MYSKAVPSTQRHAAEEAQIAVLAVGRDDLEGVLARVGLEVELASWAKNASMSPRAAAPSGVLSGGMCPLSDSPNGAAFSS